MDTDDAIIPHTDVLPYFYLALYSEFWYLLANISAREDITKAWSPDCGALCQ